MLAATARVPGEAAAAPVVGSQMLDSSHEATEASKVIGTPDACIARLKELEAVGVDYVLFNDPWCGIEQPRFFSREVMGAFAARPSEERAITCGSAPAPKPLTGARGGSPRPHSTPPNR